MATPQEQIKAKLDIVTLVQSYIKLEKSGMNFKSRCPFHGEKSASFYVSPARDIWHCFGCGKGGDIFKFVMEIEHADFPEALRILAERTGVEIDRKNFQEQSGRKRLLEALEESASFFEHNLSSYAPAKKYIESRGLTEETIKSFRVGYAPDSWKALFDHLKRKGFGEKEIERAGLSIQGNRGPYDRFRSRIIFPLEDSQGRVIGFGGRIFEEGLRDKNASSGAKYINTPQTELYDKSRFLYGLSKSKLEIGQTKNVVVVEGYMDMILSYQAGIRNVVAVSGTALTESHLKILRRMTDSLVFSFDVDAAGIEASRRAVGLAHTQDFHVLLADIEGGKDPADIAREHPERWREMVSKAEESISFFLKKSARTHPPSDPFSKKKIGEEILPLVSRLANEIERAHWIGELSRVLKISEEALWRELAKYKAGETPDLPSVAAVPERPKTLNRKARLEEHLAGMLLQDPQLATLGDIPTRQECSLSITGEIFETLRTKGFHGTTEEFLGSLPEDIRAEASRLLFEAEIMLAETENKPGEFLHMLRSWKELSLKERLERLKEEIAELELAGRKEESRAYMQEFHALASHLASIISLHTNPHGDKKEKTN